MKSLDKYMITTWVMHGINIIIHGIIVTIALLTLLTGNTDNFMGDFFADLFSLIFLLTSGVSFFGCLLFLCLFIILRKKKANTSYRIVNGFQMLSLFGSSSMVLFYLLLFQKVVFLCLV